jgi:hypothetical protein
MRGVFPIGLRASPLQQPLDRLALGEFYGAADGRLVDDEIPRGRHLRQELLPQLVDDVGDRAVRKGCQNQLAYDGQAFPDSRPFAAEVHGAAFIAGGLVYPVAAVSGQRREAAG